MKQAVALVFLASSLSLSAQKLQIDVKVTCKDCMITSGGPEGISSVKGVLNYSLFIEGGRGKVVMVVPADTLNPNDITLLGTLIEGERRIASVATSGTDVAILSFMDPNKKE